MLNDPAMDMILNAPVINGRIVMMEYGGTAARGREYRAQVISDAQGRKKEAIRYGPKPASAWIPVEEGDYIYVYSPAANEGEGSADDFGYSAYPIIAGLEKPPDKYRTRDITAVAIYRVERTFTGTPMNYIVAPKPYMRPGVYLKLVYDNFGTGTRWRRWENGQYTETELEEKFLEPVKALYQKAGCYLCDHIHYAVMKNENGIGFYV